MSNGQKVKTAFHSSQFGRGNMSLKEFARSEAEGHLCGDHYAPHFVAWLEEKGSDSDRVWLASLKAKRFAITGIRE